jgi:hypothetical protein
MAKGSITIDAEEFWSAIREYIQKHYGITAMDIIVNYKEGEITQIVAECEFKKILDN